ncbi:hypothetical protein [Marinobacter sp. F4206]|uniref:hypothetical protein n=1 Tax=Marinobacter sp. F4206 TaxID=2861777 RepID=UPI001C5E3F46|nr:hypothetical protein [Marinobacter sp. F4206]MBW4934878.1 hypothetical protein [Marinobacter sp. F4206]
MFEEKAIILLGAMFSALIAGYFAFTNLVASKENKISEFRQDWINLLRDSISCYISSLSYLSTLYIHYASRPEEKRDKFEMARDVEKIYAKVNELYNDIIFRINDIEKRKKGKELNDAFLSALYKTREHYHKNELAEARSACEPLRETSKPLLKHQWKRVKAGEWNYRVSKYLAVLVLISGLVAALFNANYILSKGDDITVSQESPNKYSDAYHTEVSPTFRSPPRLIALDTY